MNNSGEDAKKASFRLSVSFSGGGLRAAFFALGAYRRLVEIGLSGIVEKLSSVSGGSVTAAKIAVEATCGPFTDLEDFDRRVTRPLTQFGQFGIRARIMQRWRPWRAPRTTFSRALIELLDEQLFHGMTMGRLAGEPALTINATSLHTGRRFRFKRTDMGDSAGGITTDIDDVTVAFAVACSAAFPMLFAPIGLDTTGRTFHAKYWDTRETLVALPPRTLWLTDGGVYDNLGSEPLLSAKDPFLLVDASKFAGQWHESSSPGYFARTWRPLETGLDQVVSLRRRLLYERAITQGGLLLMLRDPVSVLARENRHGRFGADDPVALSDVPELDQEVQGLLVSLRTDFDAFSENEIGCLMWAGAAQMHVAVRRYLDGFMPATSHAPPAPPVTNVGELRAELVAGQARWYLGRRSSMSSAMN
jgi:NTE family protein